MRTTSLPRPCPRGSSRPTVSFTSFPPPKPSRNSPAEPACFVALPSPASSRMTMPSSPTSASTFISPMVRRDSSSSGEGSDLSSGHSSPIQPPLPPPGFQPPIAFNPAAQAFVCQSSGGGSNSGSGETASRSRKSREKYAGSDERRSSNPSTSCTSRKQPRYPLCQELMRPASLLSNQPIPWGPADRVHRARKDLKVAPLSSAHGLTLRPHPPDRLLVFLRLPRFRLHPRHRCRCAILIQQTPGATTRPTRPAIF